MSNPHQLAVLLYGGGGHGAVVEAAILQGEDYYVAGIFDDDKAALGRRVVHGVVQGGREAMAPFFKEGILRVHVGIGDNATRRRVSEELLGMGCELVTVVHKGGWVEPGAEVGAGSFIAVRGVVGARAQLGRGVIVNTGATVDHDCVVGEYVHVAPGAHLAGGVRVGAEALIGMGALVLPGVNIGRGAVVGAGAVVLRNVGDGAVVAGNPARVIREGSGGEVDRN
ncbi:MAG: acetyltransferase [bacterium]|nr:acetyltransferase [bacterium]